MKNTYDRQTLRDVIERNFTFADLSKRFVGVDSSTGNIFCPFHENHETPAAKMYWDEDRGIWIIHCFGECHRNFTAYDYVEIILCNKYEKYQSPLHFLKVNMPDYKLGNQLEISKKRVIEGRETSLVEKKIYIDNTFVETGNIVDFIERLYTA